MVDPRQVLTDPAAAFATEEEPTLFAPVLIVVAYGTVALLTVAPVLAELADLLPETVAISVAVGGERIAAPGLPVAIMAIGIPLLVLLWALATGVAYGGTRLLDGDADPVATAAFVGWGFLPKLVGALALGVLVVVAALLDPSVTATELFVGARENLEVAGLRIDGPGGPLLPVIFVIEVLAILWTTYVWYGGLRGRSALDRRRALALTVVLFLLFNGV